MLELKERKCVPCKEGANPMGTQKIAEFKTQLASPWQVIENKKLKKAFTFSDFKRAIALVQEIAVIAEEEQHHPDILFGWGYAEIKITTHAIEGLSENDFILAAKIDNLFNV